MRKFLRRFFHRSVDVRDPQSEAETSGMTSKSAKELTNNTIQFTETEAEWPSYHTQANILLANVLREKATTDILTTIYDSSFDENSGWPRRLLHVPSMTSFNLQPWCPQITRKKTYVS